MVGAVVVNHPNFIAKQVEHFRQPDIAQVAALVHVKNIALARRQDHVQMVLAEIVTLVGK